MRHIRRESIQAALALLLGPETDYDVRVHATRRLTRLGSAVLPLLLTTLSNYPEITTPSWPWWPPQYEHISRVLLYLREHEGIVLEQLLRDPCLQPPAGPVLWASVLETTNLLPHVDYEPLLCEGLTTPWTTVRYCAALALATRAGKALLHAETLTRLKEHVGEHEADSIRLAAAFALLHSGEQVGLEHLLLLTDPSASRDVRQAAVFMLATDLPVQLTLTQREQLALRLLEILLDPTADLAQQAALALGKIALPSSLTPLFRMLETSSIRRQVLALTTLEEMAHKRYLRYLMRQHLLPTRLLPLLKADDQELRRQACYTLAACGGEYAAAVFGTLVLNREHAGHVEAIESLRQLRGVLRAPMRANVVRWLLRAVAGAGEEELLTIIDTLMHLLWQAKAHGYKRVWHEMSNEIVASNLFLRLIQLANNRIRLRLIELLAALDGYLETEGQVHQLLHHFLRTRSDTALRVCIVSVYGQTRARWALSELIYALLDPDEQVARAALHALEEIAGPADALVCYVVAELAHLHDGGKRPVDILAYEAWMLMKKWRQIEEDEAQKVAQF